MADESDAVREAVAEMVRDHTMPPNKDRHGYDYRMGWWDAVTYLDSLVKRRVREARATPAEPACDGYTVACLAHPDSTLRTATWPSVEAWCDTHAETVPHDARWGITFRTNVGVTYRQPVLTLPPGKVGDQ